MFETEFVSESVPVFETKFIKNNEEAGSGKDGKSAYEIALKHGFIGTEKEWLESLHGEDGYTPIKGVDYFDGEKGDKGDKGDKGEAGTAEQWIFTLADGTEILKEVYVK